MVFQMTPGTEAPAEMNTYFPQFRAMWMAENSTNTMHNILTLRGAQVRDPLKWASYLNETIDLYGDKTSTSSSRAITGRCGATTRSSTTGRSSVTCTSTFTTSR